MQCWVGGGWGTCGSWQCMLGCRQARLQPTRSGRLLLLLLLAVVKSSREKILPPDKVGSDENGDARPAREKTKEWIIVASWCLQDWDTEQGVKLKWAQSHLFFWKLFFRRGSFRSKPTVSHWKVTEDMSFSQMSSWKMKQQVKFCDTGKLCQITFRGWVKGEWESGKRGDHWSG